MKGYPEKKGTEVEEDEYVLCSLDGYPEMNGTGVEEDDYVLWGVDGLHMP